MDAEIRECRRLLRVAQGDARDVLHQLEAADRLTVKAEELKAELVAAARRQGRTWAEVGEVLEVTRQSAQQRYGESTRARDHRRRRVAQSVAQTTVDEQVQAAEREDQERAAGGRSGPPRQGRAREDRAAELDAIARQSKFLGGGS